MPWSLFILPDVWILNTQENNIIFTTIITLVPLFTGPGQISECIVMLSFYVASLKYWLWCTNLWISQLGIKIEFMHRGFRNISKFNFFFTMVSKFDSSNLYTCEICAKSFQSKQSFSNHKATHKEVPSPCDICTKVFKSSRNLKQHKSTVYCSTHWKYF